jgi:hypothetical protein
MNTTENPAPALPAYATEVTYAEGAEIRICEQTASRDYTAKIVPGTYPVRYTTVSYHPFREGADQYAPRPEYACIDVEIDTPTRSQSSVEFGGVALAFEHIAGTRKAHTIVRYAYQMIED